MTSSSVLSFLANMNPYLVVAVLGLAYLHRACTHWRWPLLIDPLLLALYAWRPSLGMLACVLALYAVRHMPALAREVAIIFNLDAYEGWTVRAIVFLLPGLESYSDTPALPPLPAAPATGATALLDPTAVPTGMAAPPDALRPNQWLQLVNELPQTTLHLFVEGGTGFGKSMLVRYVLHHRQDQIAIVGIKPDDEWGDGYVYHSSQRGHALQGLLIEVNRRLDENDKSGLTIVLDDATRLCAHYASAVELYKLIADVGRSLSIRLILIARGRLLKGISSSGESDILEHFIFMRLSRDHTAVLEFDDDTMTIDTADVLRLGRPPLPPTRWYIADPTGWLPADVSTESPTHPPPIQAGSQPATQPRSAPEALIEQLYRERYTDKATMRLLLLQRYGYGLNNTRFSAIRQRIEAERLASA